MNVHAAYLAIITFRRGVTDEDQRDRRLTYIIYGLNHVSHAHFQSLSLFNLWLHQAVCIDPPHLLSEVVVHVSVVH